MGKGGFNGGSTVIGPGSGWFSYKKKAPKAAKAVTTAPTLKKTRSERTKEAAERLAKAQAEYDGGEWKLAYGPGGRRGAKRKGKAPKT